VIKKTDLPARRFRAKGGIHKIARSDNRRERRRVTVDYGAGGERSNRLSSLGDERPAGDLENFARCQEKENVTSRSQLRKKEPRAGGKRKNQANNEPLQP